MVGNTKANLNKHWTSQDIASLRNLAKGDTPTGLIAYDLKRTKAAVESKASQLNISLKPVNKSPYNRHTK